MRRWLILLFLIFDLKASASNQAFFDFENSLTDVSGNSRNGSTAGTGGTFYSGNPLGHLNTYCIGGFSDTNYISLPTSVFTGMASTGMIKISSFNNRFASSPAVFLSADTTSNGNFFTFGQGSELKIRIPTTTGYQEFISSGAGIPPLQWVTFFVYWSSSNVKVDFLNPVSGVQTTIINGTTTPGIVSFSGVTNVRVGRDSVLNGFSSPGYVDNLGFYTAVSPIEEKPVRPEYLICQFGHSFVEGYNGVNGSCTSSFSDGERLAMINQFATLGLSAYFVGRFTRGTLCVSPLTEGAGGTKIADFDTGGSHDISTALASVFPNPNNHEIVILGPIERNDANAGTSLSSYTASYENVLTKINAYSPLIKIVVQTNAQPTEAVAEAPYNARSVTSFNYGLSQSFNMLGVIDWGSQTTTAWCDDTIHPLAAGYTTWGSYTANRLFNLLFSVRESSNYIIQRRRRR